MRRIAHIDMDAFFAAVERQRRPELAGKPLVIGGRGDPHARGVVATASYEARRFGIHSAMPLRIAFRLCPEAVFLRVDYQAYAAVSEKVKAALRSVSPVLEDAGIDEAFLDLSALPGSPEEIGREIKRRVQGATGLTCSVGIGPNKLLAKIASDLQKPDGLTILAAEDAAARVGSLPVRKVPGIGPVTEAELGRLGVKTIGELAGLSIERLVGEFGPSRAAFLYEAARGIDERELVTHWEPKSRSRETTFQQDTRDIQTVRRTIAGQAREIADELRAEGYRGRRVGIKIRFAGFDTHTREHTLPGATDAAEPIRRAAFACLQRLPLDRPVRLVGVRVGELERTGA
ncbi:MAG: DNA polymerase IV [Burkholderiales bacterium]|nr:DNA polymerase IV [Burkholderiales bacterium]